MTKKEMRSEAKQTLLKDINLDPEISTGGCFQSNFEASYQDLVDLLGEPGDGDMDKTDADWVLSYKGYQFDIYNYKDGPNYCGPSGTPVEFITDWHIGGEDGNLHLIQEFISRFREIYPKIKLPTVSKSRIKKIHSKIDKLTPASIVALENFLEDL